METKSGDLTIKQASEGKVIATLARLGVRDRDGDMLKAGLLAGGQLVAIKPQHKWDHVDLGVAQVYETQQGTLEAAMEFNMAIPSARDWFEAVRFSHEKQRRQQYSFGFEILDFSHESHEGKPIRVLKSIAMAEVSPVLIGASIGSETLIVKTHPQPAPRRQYWPGGFSPMNSAKEHLSSAVPSVRTARRHVETARRLMGDIPPTAKTKRVNEYLDASLEELDTGVIAIETSVEHWPEPIMASEVTPTPTPVKAVEPTASSELSPEPASTATSEGDEKGGTDSVHQWVETTIDEVDRLSKTLENIKRKRASSSERYPHGRPVSAERLEQVERLIAGLCQLKAQGSPEGQPQSQEQQELHEMAERLKRLGVSV